MVELVGGECFLLDAAERVRVNDRSVSWNGVRLDTLDALLVEAPLLSWPQPEAEFRAVEPAVELGVELQRRGFARRERRSLHVSALRVLAGRVRVGNDPARASELGTSAALALLRLERAGVAVRPWRILPQPSGAAGWCATALMAEPDSTVGPGRPCLEVELGAVPARALLVVDGRCLAASEPRAAIDERPSRTDSPASAAERALGTAALGALGLDFGLVQLCDGAVARVSVAPALDDWDRACDGEVARALARWLAAPRSSAATASSSSARPSIPLTHAEGT